MCVNGVKPHWRCHFAHSSAKGFCCIPLPDVIEDSNFSFELQAARLISAESINVTPFTRNPTCHAFIEGWGRKLGGVVWGRCVDITGSCHM